MDCCSTFPIAALFLLNVVCVIVRRDSRCSSSLVFLSHRQVSVEYEYLQKLFPFSRKICCSHPLYFIIQLHLILFSYWRSALWTFGFQPFVRRSEGVAGLLSLDDKLCTLLHLQVLDLSSRIQLEYKPAAVLTLLRFLRSILEGSTSQCSRSLHDDAAIKASMHQGAKAQWEALRAIV